ncbi:Chaperone protein HscC [Pseudomonas amygdali pv. hibisci]|uniref:Chaperone protein HscC n=16 Tax=Pseudomonas syringae group TaxID=136849 RepID=A0AAX1VNS4_PSEAJ|nr:Chaperone protein HscC [Pseudomonas amygdali]KPX36245.1 Chaperone protein HscC [Pseudomonas amygdali pv. eriobotryae]KPX57626.1 Chaperone protein HscC [Pseudomonas amygdali pv. photiniae]KPX60265.1 Chaperone protein HscC [Pseudomonas amygdali pv. lachrymans]KPX82755.1 Chaperone protein HscC [Pseudomonas amygdali pv. mellea]KUG40944.1 Chaperone protein HscC [Pseudomonas savastanoi pv. fraxini]RML77094.1 Chaperone protein HscC [Pseudomonas amygdali pv. tabaci]RMN61331.1 Chaperone protein Hs
MFEMIVGIDLGTTNSLVAVWRDGSSELVTNALGETLTPSVVGLDDEGQILVGKAARERLQTHPEKTTALFKRYMGSAQEIRLGSATYRPEELSSLVLKSLKADVERAFGEPVTEAVISVPAYFSDAQRKATRIAGELAGLKVEKLINEPTAAALAYGLHQKEGETSFLVFDLGGGTFDISILELFDGVMEVRASAGDNFLGGEDFDRLLVEHFLTLHRDEQDFPGKELVTPSLRREAERVRKALGQENSVDFVLRHADREWRKTITQEQMNDLFAPLLARLRAPIERALRDAKIRVADLDEILLVGGTTRMPLIRKLAAGMFGRFPAITLNPDEVVAQGAAIQAALKQRDAALEEVVLTDVCPYTLGIETTQYVFNGYQSGHYLPIIERNSVVPVSRVRTVNTVADNQEHVLLRIFQGESRLVKDNIALGELNIPVPKAKAGEVELDVRFTYDNNGLLEADVRIQMTGENHKLVIENNPGVMTPAEIRERLKVLEALKVHPREQQVNTHLTARLERLYQEYLGEARETIGVWAAQFQRVLETQDDRQINELRKQLEQEADRFERGEW